jgi:V/A-type H+-transporting ATPase subunit I
MAKIAVIGPKEDLMDLLALVRRLGVMHIDEQPPVKLEDSELEGHLKTLHLDRQTLARRVFYEELREKIDKLFSYLPPEPSRQPLITPGNIVDSISEVIDLHLARCRKWVERENELRRALSDLSRYREFLDAVAEMVPAGESGGSLDHIGVEIRDPAALSSLERLGDKATDGCFELQSTTTESGKMVGVITTEKEFVEKIRQALAGQQFYDYTLPEGFAGLAFPDQVDKLRQLFPQYQAESLELQKKLSQFTHWWRGIYQLFLQWLNEQLVLIGATASLFETEMCFVISGWLPAHELPKLEEQVAATFGGRVIIDQKELCSEDLARVPTQLDNRGYFQPFELLTKLLPVPGYGSFDLTPFIGIFFPIFFGLMLGDLGYGLLLLLPALALAKLARNRYFSDAGKILGIAAVYTMVFGWLFGEFFGTIGKSLWAMQPVLIDRHQAIIPMFYFAVAVGLVHILLGLLLGAIASFRYHERKAAWFKLASILVILCIPLVIGTMFLPSFQLIKRPVLIVLLAAMPVLLLTGGLLAPLEVLKHFGNIISYARIMAIGLTSVLLAHVANSMVGMIGSIWLGIFAAVLLHAFNIILGVFAPTIHGLRLHYVEFFSKIMNGGGQEFSPLDDKKDKEQQITGGSGPPRPG